MAAKWAVSLVVLLAVQSDDETAIKLTNKFKLNNYDMKHNHKITHLS